MNGASSMRLNLLKCAVALGGLVPVAAGLAGVIMGTTMINGPDVFSIELDSHYRYLSGLLLAIGLGFWSTIRHIEEQGERFRLLSAIVVTGGLGRLVSVYVLGWPGKNMLFGLGMELVVVPLLALWQYRAQKSLAGRHKPIKI
jgi:uncharacterized membrane protein YfcA